MKMNLSGININNSYLIRKKLFDDDRHDVWLCNSIFSTKMFALKFLRKKEFKNRRNFNSFRQEYADSKKTPGKHVINFLEIDGYRDFFFISMEVPPGGSFPDAVCDNLKKRNMDKLVKILAGMIDTYSSLITVSFPVEHITARDFWVSNNEIDGNSIYFMNFQKHIIKKYAGQDVFAERLYKLFLDKKKEMVLPGIFLYQAVTSDIELERIGEFLERHKSAGPKKNRLTGMVYDILNGSYKNLDDMRNDLMKLLPVNKDAGEKKETHGYKDIYEERRRYFENLENERRKKITTNRIEEKSDTAKEDISLREYNRKLFDERRFYFEHNETERWKYLNTAAGISDAHMDSMMEKSKAYYENRMKRDIEKNIPAGHSMIKGSIPGLIGNISNQTKKHFRTLKKEKMKYLDKIVKSNNSEDFKYLDKRRTEADKLLKQLAYESKSYFNNISQVMKNDLESDFNALQDGMPAGKSANVPDDSIAKEMMKVQKIIDKTNEYYQKVINKEKRKKNSGTNKKATKDKSSIKKDKEISKAGKKYSTGKKTGLKESDSSGKNGLKNKLQKGGSFSDMVTTKDIIQNEKELPEDANINRKGNETDSEMEDYDLDEISRKESESLRNSPYFWIKKIEKIIHGEEKESPEKKEKQGTMIPEQFQTGLEVKGHRDLPENIRKKMDIFGYIRYLFIKLLRIFKNRAH